MTGRQDGRAFRRVAGAVLLGSMASRLPAAGSPGLQAADPGPRSAQELRYGPDAGTPPERWQELRRWVATVLDASEDAAAMSAWFDAGMRPEDWPFDFAFERWGTVFYPTVDPHVLEARARILATGRRAVPAILDELVRLDPRDPHDMHASVFATSLLAELACGHFAWRYGDAPDDAAWNAQVIASWARLWDRVRSDADFWDLIASRGARQRLPRAWEHEASGVDLGLGEAVRPFLKVEPVLDPGQRLRATTSQGSIEICADDGFGRYYTWDRGTRFVVLDPEPAKKGRTRALGLGYPGPGDHWEEHHGITRGVLQEGVMDFDDVEAAMAWIRSLTWMDYVHTPDGWVVGWSKNPSRRQINVDLWRVRVAGAWPASLPEGRSEAVSVE